MPRKGKSAGPSGLIVGRQACAGNVTRQVRILQRRYQDAGAAGLISGHRGKPSNRALPTAMRRKAINLVRQRYAHLGPTRVCEHLANRHGISVSAATLNTWMTAAGLWQPRSKKVVQSATGCQTKQGHELGRHYVPPFDNWILDTQALVATSDGPSKGKKTRHRIALETLRVAETITFADERVYRNAPQAKHKISRDTDKRFVTRRDAQGHGTVTRLPDAKPQRRYWHARRKLETQ